MKDTFVYSFRQKQNDQINLILKKEEKQKTIISRKAEELNKVCIVIFRYWTKMMGKRRQSLTDNSKRQRLISILPARWKCLVNFNLCFNLEIQKQVIAERQAYQKHSILLKNGVLQQEGLKHQVPDFLILYDVRRRLSILFPDDHYNC